MESLKSLRVKERVVHGFRNYLTANKKSAENIFFFLNEESFKDFLAKFEPDISEYPSIKDMYRFLREEVFGKSIVIVWDQAEPKIGEVVYTFTTCKFIEVKERHLKEIDLVIWGCSTELTLRRR